MAVDAYGSVKFKIDRRHLDDLERLVPGRVAEMAHELADETADLIQERWSPYSPSLPNRPPGIKTGNLSENIEVRPVSQGFVHVRGWAVIANTRYSGFLEKGTRKMAKRPFLGPAAFTVAHDNLGKKAREVMKVGVSYYD